jgi:hypothetical protein
LLKTGGDRNSLPTYPNFLALRFNPQSPSLRLLLTRSAESPLEVIDPVSVTALGNIVRNINIVHNIVGREQDICALI